MGQNTQNDFVLDKTKPFVYLVLDHISKGKLFYEGDAPERLYFRVVNNCRIPILFRSHPAPGGESGSILDDEVVPEEKTLKIVSTQEEMSASEAEERDREEALKHKPSGYTSEVFGVLRVAPGKDGLFSVPSKHVGRFWFLRVKFALDVDRSSVSTGPFTYLDFHAYDLPKK